MKFLMKSALFLAILLISCENDQKGTAANFSDENSNVQKTTPAETAVKQAPVFTPFELPYPFSSSVQVGDILYLSGEIGVNGEGTGMVPGGIEPETHRTFERIKATLAHHDLGLNDVFKCTVMLADMSEWQSFNEIYSGYFEPARYPTRSAMGVNGLALGAQVELECWAYNPQTN